MEPQQRIAQLQEDIERLEAVRGIRDTVARYSYAVDTENWAELDQIYTEDAVVDRRWRGELYKGKQAVLGLVKGHRQQVQFTNRMSDLNLRVSVKGHAGTANSYALVMYTYQGESYIGWGAYEWDLRLDNGMWRISKETIKITVMTTLKRGWGMETDRVLTLPHLQKVD